jgi:hypothetical protein
MDTLIDWYLRFLAWGSWATLQGAIWWSLRELEAQW